MIGFLIYCNSYLKVIVIEIVFCEKGSWEIIVNYGEIELVWYDNNEVIELFCKMCIFLGYSFFIKKDRWVMCFYYINGWVGVFLLC